VAKYGDATQDDLQSALDSKKTPMIEKIVCKVMLVAYLSGDHTKLNFFLDRTVGKVKEVKEIQVLPSPFIITRPSGETITMGAQHQDAIDAEVLDDG